MVKTVIEETREPCRRCGGSGQVDAKKHQLKPLTCGLCQGSGQVLTKIVTRCEQVEMGDLSPLLPHRILANLRAQKVVA